VPFPVVKIFSTWRKSLMISVFGQKSFPTSRLTLRIFDKAAVIGYILPNADIVYLFKE